MFAIRWYTDKSYTTQYNTNISCCFFLFNKHIYSHFAWGWIEIRNIMATWSWEGKWNCVEGKWNCAFGVHYNIIDSHTVPPLSLPPLSTLICTSLTYSLGACSVPICLKSQLLRTSQHFPHLRGECYDSGSSSDHYSRTTCKMSHIVKGRYCVTLTWQHL